MIRGIALYLLNPGMSQSDEHSCSSVWFGNSDGLVNSTADFVVADSSRRKRPIETSYDDERYAPMVFVETAMNNDGSAMCRDVVVRFL